MKRIYLIDCPGVVPPSNNDSEQDILLRGVVRVENVEHPEQYIQAVLNKTKPQHIERTYDIRGYNNPTEFLELLARKGGRLLRGGEADVDGVAKMVLNDFLRGKIPWFTPPPVTEGEITKGIDGREGRLGEMGKKRKRGDEASITGEPDMVAGDSEAQLSGDDFEDFGDESRELIIPGDSEDRSSHLGTESSDPASEGEEPEEEFKVGEKD